MIFLRLIGFTTIFTGTRNASATAFLFIDLDVKTPVYAQRLKAMSSIYMPGKRIS